MVVCFTDSAMPSHKSGYALQQIRYLYHFSTNAANRAKFGAMYCSKIKTYAVAYPAWSFLHHEPAYSFQ